MTNGSSAQGVYAPLPQSMSDSDSEKEMPTPEGNKVQAPHPQNGTQESKLLPPAKVPEVKTLAPQMSSRRRFCFILSILVCLLTITVFLWALPCSESGTCPVRIANWENQHDGIELMGSINSVKSAFRNTLNLALFFRGSFNLANSQSGVISILGNNGAVAWYIPQLQPPSELDCYLLDTNGDDIVDCLILGEFGLEAIDPVSGTIFWHAHNHSQNMVMSGLGFPHKVQDLNHDNINELLSVKNSIVEKPKFVIISGKTGALEGEINVEFCDQINMVEKGPIKIVYSCMNGYSTDYHEIEINIVVNRIITRQQMISGLRIDYFTDPNVGYTLNRRKLMVNNVGSCPDNCHVEIELFDQKNNHKIISWSYQNSYAMTPVTFTFSPTQANLIALKGHLNGFILKLWQWIGYSREDKGHVVKRYIPNTNTTIEVNSIMESVVLITFNNTNFHVINASLTEITQLCFFNDHLKTCQPSLENQNESLLISDLDMDGAQELVSYSSTFVKKDEAKENWQLVSSMKVIRLESELPKLYDAAK